MSQAGDSELILHKQRRAPGFPSESLAGGKVSKSELRARSRRTAHRGRNRGATLQNFSATFRRLLADHREVAGEGFPRETSQSMTRVPAGEETDSAPSFPGQQVPVRQLSAPQVAALSPHVGAPAAAAASGPEGASDCTQISSRAVM